ncbi:MAG: TIGR04283 family arsenosugar biosynthesis glycosyltransferase [Sulfitobacter sp.]
MRAPVSVIIPTLNAQGVLRPCFDALLEGLDAGLIRELIVSDGGSVDATCVTAQAWGAEVLQGPASRGGQLRRGCAVAKGEWLLVLHADTVLAPGWAKEVQAHLDSKEPAWFQLAFEGGGLPARLVAGWANLRSRFLGLPYGDQGFLIPHALYQAVGGYPDQPLMEDVAFARALRGRLKGLSVTAVTSADKYRKQGWLRRGSRNLWRLCRYFAGASPEVLARGYQEP